MNAYKIINDATESVLSLAEVKNYLRVDFNDDDNLISVLIKSSVNQVESLIQKSLISTELEFLMDGFPKNGNEFSLSIYGVTEISSIKYFDENDTLQTWDSSNYTIDLDSFRTRIGLNTNSTFPTTNDKYHSVVVRFKSGKPNAASVEEDIKNALLLIIADMYERREDRILKYPKASEVLLNPYKPLEIL